MSLPIAVLSPKAYIEELIQYQHLAYLGKCRALQYVAKFLDEK